MDPEKCNGDEEEHVVSESEPNGESIGSRKNLFGESCSNESKKIAGSAEQPREKSNNQEVEPRIKLPNRPFSFDLNRLESRILPKFNVWVHNTIPELLREPSETPSTDASPESETTEISVANQKENKTVENSGSPSKPGIPHESELTKQFGDSDE